MAISFSRPDPSSPSAVAAATFSTARRGYDQNEVRELLRMVAAELGRLQEREKFLERELRTNQQSPHTPTIAIDDEVVTRMLGEEAARILHTAREAGTQIKIRAEEGAARLLREATDEAQRMREESEVEASRRRSDASADAEAELQMAKQQGREMVNEARAYRERVLGELSRRRELARQQIEQLVHGRDRLLQAFERARLAAVDVMSELAPLGTPSEYVNLSPTTGPIPVMVPASAATPVAPQSVDEMLAEVDALIPPPEVDVADGSEAAESAADAAPEAEVVPEAAADADAESEVGVDVHADVQADAAHPVAIDGAGDESAELVDSAVDDTVVLLREPAEAAADAAADVDDVEDSAPSAPVVNLFAGEIDRTPRPAPGPAPGDGVDSVIAKLRAARLDEVARLVGDVPPPADQTTMLQRPPTDSVFAPSDAGPDDAVDDDDDSPFGRRDAALTPLIVAAARRTKRVLADEQNELLHLLRRAPKLGSIDDLLPSAAEQRGRYATAMTDELHSAALAGAASVDIDGTKGRGQGINEEHAVEPALTAMDTVLVAPLRERISRAVDDAAGDADELAAHLRSIYREWKTQRIDEHLDDIARLAYGRGQLLALAPGTKVCWIVDPNGPPCPDAEDNSLAGSIDAGQPFPTEHVYPPAHPGCRCLLARAAADEAPR